MLQTARLLPALRGCSRPSTTDHSVDVMIRSMTLRTLFNGYFHPLPEIRGFLHAIREQPDEDTHRLALADFLDERQNEDRGDVAHARLIRLQCEYARTEPYTHRWFEKVSEASTLMHQHREKLIRPGISAARYSQFVRGLPTAVRVNGPSHLRNAEPAFAVGTISSLDVSSVRSVNALIRQPLLGRVAGLCMKVLYPGDLSRVIAEADVARLRHWSAPGSRLAGIDVRTLSDAVCRGTVAVETLDLSDCSFLDEDEDYAELLAEIARRMREGRLNLSGRSMARDLLRRLVRQPSASGYAVRQLVLDRVELGNEHIAELAGWPGAANLEFLAASQNSFFGPPQLTDRGLVALAGSPYLSGLRVLRLDGGGITDLGLAALARVPASWDLRWVSVRRTSVTQRGVAVFRDRFPDCRVDVTETPPAYRIRFLDCQVAVTEIPPNYLLP